MEMLTRHRALLCENNFAINQTFGFISFSPRKNCCYEGDTLQAGKLLTLVAAGEGDEIFFFQVIFQIKFNEFALSFHLLQCVAEYSSIPLNGLVGGWELLTFSRSVRRNTNLVKKE